MWEALINIIERTWKEQRNPRRRVAKAMLGLHAALENCHLSFLAYKQEPTRDHLKAWKISIDTLIETLLSLEPVLKIVQANIWAILSYYCWDEFYHSEMRSKTEYEDAMLDQDIRSHLVTLELVTKYDNKALYNPNETDKRYFDTFDESRQRFLRQYHEYLVSSGISAREVIHKYQGDLVDIDDADFKNAIKKLRDWIKSEFKPEELL